MMMMKRLLLSCFCLLLCCAPRMMMITPRKTQLESDGRFGFGIHRTRMGKRWAVGYWVGWLGRGWGLRLAVCADIFVAFVVVVSGAFLAECCWWGGGWRRLMFVIHRHRQGIYCFKKFRQITVCCLLVRCGDRYHHHGLSDGWMDGMGG